MLSMTGHQGNTNKNYSEIHSIHTRMVIIKNIENNVLAWIWCNWSLPSLLVGM